MPIKAIATETVIEISWGDILELIAKTGRLKGNNNFWTDGERILCDTETEASVVANFLEEILGYELCTGFYDPAEDQNAGTVDAYTGLWYISPNS